MKMRMTNEAKTGMIVLVSAVALGALLIKVGNFTLLQKGYTVRSQFYFTSGVKKHAPVRLSGVDVGEVKDIRLHYGADTSIELLLWFKEGVKIRLDSKAYVTTLGMMGEKYIEIKAGTAASEYAKEGDLIPSEDPIRLEDLMALGTKLAEDVDKTAKDISRLANRLDETVADNRTKIDKLFENLEETSDNFREFSEDIKWHPWKILMKGKEKSKEEMAKERAKKLTPQKKA